MERFLKGSEKATCAARTMSLHAMIWVLPDIGNATNTTFSMKFIAQKQMDSNFQQKGQENRPRSKRRNGKPQNE